MTRNEPAEPRGRRFATTKLVIATAVLSAALAAGVTALLVNIMERKHEAQKMNQMPYAEARNLVAHPVACIDCHDPGTLQLRVTRPGFIEGMRALQAARGVADYDVNRDAPMRRPKLRHKLRHKLRPRRLLRRRPRTTSGQWGRARPVHAGLVDKPR